jgi:hypothetical protein
MLFYTQDKKYEIPYLRHVTQKKNNNNNNKTNKQTKKRSKSRRIQRKIVYRGKALSGQSETASCRCLLSLLTR